MYSEERELYNSQRIVLSHLNYTKEVTESRYFNNLCWRVEETA